MVTVLRTLFTTDMLITIPDNPNVLAVVLPEGAKEPELVTSQDYDRKQYIQYESDLFRGFQNYDSIELPPSQWTILGTAEQVVKDARVCDELLDDDCTYDQDDWSCYKLYGGADYAYTSSAIDSFQSLLTANNIPATAIICKKN